MRRKQHQDAKPETKAANAKLAKAKPANRRAIWKYGLLGALLVIVIVAIYYIYAILSFAGDIQRPANDIRQETPGGAAAGEDPVPIPRWEGRERVNILLLGGDSRGMGENEKPRADTMMIVSIDPVTKKAHLLSVLRDTYGTIPGYGNDRLNAALAYGGPDLAMRTIADLTGLEIQFYVYTDFQGFIALIDKLGGIEFEVEKRMYYKDSHDDPMYHIDLQPGLQVLDGQTALAYVRFRQDLLSDYTRTERQRNFLSALAGKLKSTWSLLRLPALLDSVKPHVETNLGLDEMLKLAALGLEVDTKTIASVQLPPMDLLREEIIHDMSVITVRDEEALRAYILEQLTAVEESADESGDGTKGAGDAGNEGNTGGAGGAGNGGDAGVTED